MRTIHRRDSLKWAALAGAAAASERLFEWGQAASRPKICLITGCSSGFGKLTALGLARTGHVVYASMRDTSNRNRAAAQELSDLAQAEGLQLVVIELDVRDSQRHGQVIEMMVNKSGRVDALINNAGIIVCTPADCVTPRILETQFNTNVYGPSMLSSKVLEVMTRQGQGQLITVSSTVGRLNFPGISLYCASKHALESNFETLAKESTDARIQFSLIQPGPYRTRINPNAVNILESVTIPELRRERPMLYQQRKRDLESLAERFRGIPPHDPQEVADQILRCLDGTTHKPEDGLRFPVGHGAEFPVLQEINRVHHWGQKILS